MLRRLRAPPVDSQAQIKELRHRLKSQSISFFPHQRRRTLPRPYARFKYHIPIMTLWVIGDLQTYGISQGCAPDFTAAQSST
ncbi:hypothetical protein FRC08_018460 [Ceratobasidium sp. 394]|nr:hypothetical protein FRC08_018460 [Ceratobasidium sp. 394]